jgi:hypothetical protein
VQGPQTAIVVGPKGEEIHVDKHGRVKLQFQWDRYNNADENSSCWVRVSQPWSSKGWGALFLPRIGHEVIVQFIDGDPDRPIVVGRVHNADSTPPWPLPSEKTRSGFRTRTYKGGASNFNELSFDDKQGAEEIYLHAERNHVLRVKNNRIEEIGNESHMTVKKDVFIDLKADLHEKVTGDHNNAIDGSYSLKVAQDWQTKAGLKFAVDAGQEIHLKTGANIVIEAGSSISLKVGGSFVTIHGGGVDIEGPLVKINSGGSPGSGSGASPIAAKSPARPRGSQGGTDMKPVKPPKPEAYSPQAASLQLAWKAAAPFCEQCAAAAAAAAEAGAEAGADAGATAAAAALPSAAASPLAVPALTAAMNSVNSAVTDGLANAVNDKLPIDPARAISFDRPQLQHAFKHAQDFGILGNPNNDTLAQFQSALESQVTAAATSMIQGSYRGNPVTHFLDPNTGLNVIRDAQGNFMSGWKLSAQQTAHVSSTGKLGGG